MTVINVGVLEPNMPEGSWKCEKCNNINFPFRMKCNRQNCGAQRPHDSNATHGLTSDEDDQVCDVHVCCFSSIFTVSLIRQGQHLLHCFTTQSVKSEYFALCLPPCISSIN